MCQSKSADQTPQEVIDFIKKKNINVASKDVSGIGIFFVPAPDIGILEVRTILVENLTHLECSKRGLNCEAFQWIPRGFEVVHPVSKSKVTFHTSDDLKSFIKGNGCSGSCATRCQVGCYCKGGVFCYAPIL